MVTPDADMEFVTSGTSGTCVKYFWAQVNFSRIMQKSANSVKLSKFRLDFSQNNWTEFVLEWMIAQKLTICSKEMSKTSSRAGV